METFKKLGFSRAQCPKCANYYWRHSETRKTCGDSNCEGTYSFIGNGVGKGKKNYDKRQAIAEKESKREAERATGRRSKGY